jgi:L-alanine-DL-glutamate epimerase-like enolase superfamily enzyme
LKLTLTDLHLPLRHPFTTAHGTRAAQHNLLVTLETDGFCGHGEGAASNAWPTYTAGAMRAALEAARPLIENTPFSTPEEFWTLVQPALAENPFALCALDQAAHDLWGRQQDAPVWKLWGLSLDHLPCSDYTIGLAPLDEMIAKLREFADWPIFKIKLGTDDDLAIVRALRCETRAIFRIDANTAWSAEQTIAYAPELRTLGVEFIEQPLPREDWEGMRRVKAGCVLPVIADESCQTEADVPRCAEVFDGINIKLTKAGGLTPARRMIRQARALGLKVMAGCMTESSVGISAIAQLLPLLDFVDMDGAVLLARDIATGVRLDRGRAIFPDAPGTGVRLLIA